MKEFSVKKTFLNLTQYNIPYGFEEVLEDSLPKSIKKDEIGNYYLSIGNSRTMFTAHLDDASWGYGVKEVKHIINNNIIRTDGRTVLGADDKAGVTILLYMINNNIPGTYYFFIGEESGMIGSSSILDIKKDWFIENFDRCISFDRRGYGSIISRQLGGECCSNEFVSALSKQFSNNGMIFKDDNSGIFTDSAAFIGIIPECTNISVGYFNEHSNNEYQDIEYLSTLCNVCIKIDWENLPVIGVGDIIDDYIMNF